MLQFKWIPLKLKDYKSLYLYNTFKQRNKIISLEGGKVKRILKMKIKRKKPQKKNRKKKQQQRKINK
jgi:hypothetical protein